MAPHPDTLADRPGFVAVVSGKELPPGDGVPDAPAAAAAVAAYAAAA